MPKQEIVFDEMAGDRRIEVLKAYDRHFAREAFSHMDQPAQEHLWKALEIEINYDPHDLPASAAPDRQDFLWEELQEAAREDGSLLSFFVVNESSAGGFEPLYVSPDFPSAESFARNRLTSLH
jgi:hypothetical protein